MSALSDTRPQMEETEADKEEVNGYRCTLSAQSDTGSHRKMSMCTSALCAGHRGGAECVQVCTMSS